MQKTISDKIAELTNILAERGDLPCFDGSGNPDVAIDVVIGADATAMGIAGGYVMMGAKP